MPILLSLIISLPPCSYGENISLYQGIEQYKQENYEEAIEALIEARKEEPQSSSAAFFLGLAYKQVLAYQEAAKNLRDSVTLKPRIKEALIELIEVLYRVPGPEALEEAKQWLAVAEKEKIFPAKTAFLKGLILQREEKNLDAISSFEQAKALDENLTQSADFQIALCYVKEKKLKKAQTQFRAAALRDPQSDLASFARQYQEMLEKRIEIERPLHLTIGVFGQYDTNVVLKPLGPTFATDITDEESYVTTTSLRADYMPLLKGPWLFNAQYRFYGNFHDRFSTTHDAISNGLYAASGYNFGRYALSLAANYDHVLLRQPDYEEYAGYLQTGPLFRVLLNQNHLLEIFSGYLRNSYHRPVTDEREDRDSNGIGAYASWIWTFMKGGLFNLRYDFVYDDTEGIWWENAGHSLSLYVNFPILKNVDLQLSGKGTIQDFKNNHILLSDMDSRDDDTFQGTVGLSWEFLKNTKLIAQYTKIRANSNIEIYEYKRSLYSLGIEYRY